MALWVVARTQSNSERRASDNVVRQGFEFYLPKYVRTSKKQMAALGAAREAYLFPTYLFVKIEHQWRWLLATTGITNVLTFGDHPATMSQAMIEQIRMREDEEGFIRLPTLAPGAAVHVAAGPFKGHSGLCEEMTAKDRCFVLLDVLGRKTRVLFAQDHLVAA